MIESPKDSSSVLIYIFCILLIGSLLQGCGSGDGSLGNSENPESTIPEPDNPNQEDPDEVAETALFGLETRPANRSCVAPSKPVSSSAVTAERAFPSLNLNGMPITSLFQNPNDLSYWYITSRLGPMYRFRNEANASELEPVLDLSDYVSTYYGELGLLNAIFHPNFPEDPRMFVYYVGLEEIGDIHLSSFTSSDNGATFDLDSERVLITLPQFRENHKGGGLAFGKDGYLYLTIGDGGAKEKAGDPNDLYGTLIRIDIDSGFPYTAPPDNPFVLSGGGAPEVWAYGLRNPWRFSIDEETGDIWTGDVGAADWEEVNRLVPGGNYGWPIREGAHCFRLPDDQCDTTGLIDPVIEYSHDVGAAVIGGHVYRGSAIPGLIGKYIYGDYSTGVVWALEANGDTVISNQELLTGIPFISAFVEDSNKEILITRAGRIMRIVPAETEVAETESLPQFLSQTGCFDRSDPSQPRNALIPYDVNSEFWSDGANKKRWMALPDGKYIDIAEDGDFLYPTGSVLIKEFTLDNKKVETRFLVRYEDGTWGGYTYLWNENQTDAELLRNGTEFDINGQLYTIPNEHQCAQCHTDIAGNALGPEISQLNRNQLYPATEQAANQLATLEHIGLLSGPLPGEPATLDKLYRLNNASRSTEEKIRSYLHSNCSQCHRPGGEERASTDFRYQADKGMNACNVDPQISDLDIEDAKLIAPGDPERSVLLARMELVGSDQMPPIARNVPHAEAISLLEEYIRELESCD